MHASVKSPTLLWRGWLCGKSVCCSGRSQPFSQC